MTQTPSRSTPYTATSRTRFLIVDDEPSIVKMMALILRQAGYICIGCQSGQDALQLIDTQEFDAILCDVQMPGMSGTELLHIVREKHPLIAFLMVTGVHDIRVGVQAMKEGADDYLLKPLNLEAVLVSIRQVLERKKLEAELENYRLHLEERVEQRTAQLRKAIEHIERTYDETLQALAAALDLKDNDTAGHSRRVMVYAVEIAKAMGFNEEQLNTIARAALLHDVGKIGIPDSVLLKPGPLTVEERSVMEKHVEIGYSLMNRIAFLADAATIVLAHHERFDGTGYPRRLRGVDIPQGARIFVVADTLDAMTSDRPYRRALPYAAAREEIIRENGKQFDPEVVSAFLAIDEATWGELRSERGIAKSRGMGGEDLLLPAQIDHAYRSLVV